MGTIWEQFVYLIVPKNRNMKVTAFIRKPPKKNNIDEQATVYFRLRDKGLDIKSASKLTINPNHWNQEKQGYKDRIALVSDEVKNEFKANIQGIISIINENYSGTADPIWLNDIIEKYHHPNLSLPDSNGDNLDIKSFAETFDEFLLKHDISEVRKKNFKVIKRSLLRYEIFVQQTTRNGEDFKLDINKVTSDTLRDIWDYFENEHEYYISHSYVFALIKEKRVPKPRGKNTLIDYFTKIRTFFLWCFTNQKTSNRPFDAFKLDESTYGTPVYITLEERDKLYKKDLSDNPKLETQRDIFVFQTLIGCRVSDLYQFTHQSIINDAIEYIAKKTKDGRPLTLRVPLNEKGKAIISKYKDHNSHKLFPFIAEQKYNEAIKKAFEIAEINRIVTILNPTTGKEEKKPIYEIASSHMARRTFVGNLYKKVKDPNLIGALSGHKDGSKAFSRYREIDEDMKKELVNLLD